MDRMKKTTIVLRAIITEERSVGGSYTDLVRDYLTDVYSPHIQVLVTDRQRSHGEDCIIMILRFRDCSLANRIKQSYNGRYLFEYFVQTNFIDMVQYDATGLLGVEFVNNPFPPSKKKSKTKTVEGKQREWLIKQGIIQEEDEYDSTSTGYNPPTIVFYSEPDSPNVENRESEFEVPGYNSLKPSTSMFYCEPDSPNIKSNDEKFEVPVNDSQSPPRIHLEYYNNPPDSQSSEMSCSSLLNELDPPSSSGGTFVPSQASRRIGGRHHHHYGSLPGFPKSRKRWYSNCGSSVALPSSSCSGSRKPWWESWRDSDEEMNYYNWNRRHSRSYSDDRRSRRHRKYSDEHDDYRSKRTNDYRDSITTIIPSSANDPISTTSTNPTSMDSTSLDCTSRDPISTDPISTDYTSTDPTSTDPSAMDPTSMDSTSIDPTSTDPTSTDLTSNTLPCTSSTSSTSTIHLGKKFKKVVKEALKFADETKKQPEKSFEPLIKWLKEAALTDKIQKAVVSNRLTSSPCAIVAGQYGWSGNMERVMKAQAYAQAKDANTEFYLNQKNLEINPRHPLIKELLRRVDEGDTDESTVDLAQVLFDTAVLRSGYDLGDSVSFASRIERMLRLGVGIDLNAPMEEEVFPSPEDDVDEEEDDEITDDDDNDDSETEIPIEDSTSDSISLKMNLQA